MLAIAVAIGLGLGAGAAGAASDSRFCSATAAVQLEACESEVEDDFFIAQAICIQVLDRAERTQCVREAEAAEDEGEDLCEDQARARRELCADLGEGRYDPHFDPALFDKNYAKPTHPNPYFPLRIGNRWKYAGEDEVVRVKVLDKTKLIEGVTCIVVNDRVEEGGELIEDTDDWFGLRKNGTVDYCGEIARDFETFEGDDPEEPELVEIAGSWKAGRDGSLAGTKFPGSPVVGRVYRQEWSPGNAEDAATVLSTNYSFGSNRELDEFVPRDLAIHLCAKKDCVVTGEFTPIEPDVFERKYYARGIGLFFSVHAETGEGIQLVGCNFDRRCGSLPKP